MQNLRTLSLEDAKAYIQQQKEALSDSIRVGNLIADEALLQRDIDPFVALKLADVLIFLGDMTPHLFPHALGLKAKGDMLNSIGHIQAAIECLDAAGEEFLRLGDEINWARSRITWIIACAWSGHVEEALAGAQQAKEAFLRHGERYWACVVDHNTAVVYSQMGQYQKALDLYEQMLAIYPTLTDKDETFIRRAIAMVEMNQARNLSWLGELQRAYALMQKAHASFVELGQVGFAIATDVNLAEFEYIQGYYGSALRRYYQARDSFIQHNFNAPPFLWMVMLQIAACLVKLKRVNEACDIAAEVLQAARQLGVSLDLGDVLREYATTLVASSRLKEAFLALDEAWHVFTAGGFHHHAFTTKLQQAELLLEMGDIAQAYTEAEQLKAYFDARGLASRSLRAGLVMVKALLLTAQQWSSIPQGLSRTETLQQAMRLCEQIIVQARHHNLQEQAYKAQHLSGQLALLQGDMHRAARYFNAAIARIERILSGLASDLGSDFLRTAWMVYEDMIALCLKQKQAEQAFRYLERARSVALRQYLYKRRTDQHVAEEQRDDEQSALMQTNNALRLRFQYDLRFWQEKYHDYCTVLASTNNSLTSEADKEAAQQELKRYEARISELFERVQLHELHAQSDLARQRSAQRQQNTRFIHRLDVARLRQSLLPDQLVLAYFIYQETLVIFALTKERLVSYEIPDGMVRLEKLLPALYMHLQPNAWPALDKPPQLTIRRLLQKLYDLLLGPVTDLLPSGTGSVTFVPYGQLHKLPFHALYNGTHFLIEDYQVNYLPASSMIEFFADSVAKTQRRSAQIKPPLVFGYSENGQLQFALEEARELATLLDARCYLEQDATIARLIEEATNSPVIHIATHGQNKLDAPNFSFVRLADGQLNAIDAFSLDLTACELVTLSGCETGLALSGGGDEQLGLGRAFLASGANSLVMSLWTVEDKATNELMQRFYQRLLQGNTKVQALRAAQCHYIRQTGAMVSHPYFWAAFRLVGDRSPLRMSEITPQKRNATTFE